MALHLGKRAKSNACEPLQLHGLVVAVHYFLTQLCTLGQVLFLDVVVKQIALVNFAQNVTAAVFVGRYDLLVYNLVH